MKFTGIEQALKDGCKICAFRSGGGLRVVSIKKDDESKGYGEHPQLEDALSHAQEDFLVGHKPYKEVYGVTKPHYITGSSTPTGPLDEWILRGHTFDVWQDGDEIIFQLNALNGKLKEITKTGRGKYFAEAMNNALDADEIETEQK